MLTAFLTSLTAIMPQININGDVNFTAVHLGFLGKRLKT